MIKFFQKKKKNIKALSRSCVLDEFTIIITYYHSNQIKRMNGFSLICILSIKNFIFNALICNMQFMNDAPF